MPVQRNLRSRMNGKKISILGGEGQMGKYFSKYFLKHQYKVSIYDEKSNPSHSSKKKTKAESLKDILLQADLVLLCTPTRKNPEIIRSVARFMKRGSHLIDISSQKSKVFSALLKIPKWIHPLCLHPMFGPGVGVKGQNIILIPVREKQRELSLAKDLFPEARFVSLSVKEHDKKMALVLGLTHLIHLSFAELMVKEKDFPLLEQVSGTTFRVQKVITESIFMESPELIQTLITHSGVKKVARKFWKSFGKKLTLIESSKTDKILRDIRSCQNSLSQKTSLENSYKKFTKITETLRKSEEKEKKSYK